MSLFKKASRKRVYLKVGLMGPSGSGKTRSALELAKGLCEGKPIAVIDTENGSASLYSHVCEFDVADLEPPFDPEKYIEAIRAAEDAGYGVLIIDSFTHAWKYLLDKKEKLDARGGKQNQYANWGPVKAEADRLRDAILQSRIHVIACMRSKAEYSQEGGKVTKVGLAAIQEPDVEYEFTTVFQIAMDHNATPTKDRTGLFKDRVFRIEPKTGEAYLNWLNAADSDDYSIPPASVATLEASATAVPTAPPNEGTEFLRSLGLDEPGLAEYKALCKALDRKPSEIAMDGKAEGVSTAEELLVFTRGLKPVPTEQADDEPEAASKGKKPAKEGAKDAA